MTTAGFLQGIPMAQTVAQVVPFGLPPNDSLSMCISQAQMSMLLWDLVKHFSTEAKE